MALGLQIAWSQGPEGECQQLPYLIHLCPNPPTSLLAYLCGPTGILVFDLFYMRASKDSNEEDNL